MNPSSVIHVPAIFLIQQITFQITCVIDTITILLSFLRASSPFEIIGMLVYFVIILMKLVSSSIFCLGL